MASQRVIIAKIGGTAATAVARLFRMWHADSSTAHQVDLFSDRLRAHPHLPPVVYFSEWTDLWSMGDLVPALGKERAAVISGKRYQATCHRPPIRFKLPRGAPDESRWLKRRVEEAEDAWRPIVGKFVILLIREPLCGSVLDDELEASLEKTPPWIEPT